MNYRRISHNLRLSIDHFRWCKKHLGLANKGLGVSQSTAMSWVNESRHQLQQDVIKATNLLYPRGMGAKKNADIS